MADQELRVKILAEDHATKTLKEVEDSVETIDQHDQIVVDVDLKGLKTGDLKSLTAELEKAKDLATTIGERDVTFRVHADNIDTVTRAMGELNAEITKVDEQTVDVKVNADNLETVRTQLDGVRTGVDEVGKSAGSSRNALANMVGNTAQDLGSMAGVAGSAGVAIGQMSEFMADATFEGEAFGKVLASFSKVALPIAALTVLVQLLGKASENVKADIDDIAKATGQGSASIAAFSDALNNSSRNVFDLSNNLAAAKFTLGIDDWDNAAHAVDVFNDVMSKSPAAAANLLHQIIPLQAQLGLTAAQVQKMSKAVATQIQNSAAAADAQKDYNQAVKDASTLLEHHVALRQKEGETVDEFTARLRRAALGYEVLDDAASKALAAQDQQWAAYVAGLDTAKAATDAAAASVEKNSKAVINFATDMASAWDRGALSAGEFGKAFTDDFEKNFKIHDVFVESAKAIGEFGDDIKDTSKKGANALGHLTSEGEDGQKIFEALAKIGPKIGDDLAESLVRAGGNFDGVRERAQELRDMVEKQLKIAKVDPSEFENYFNQLRINPPQIEALIKITATQTKQDIVDKLLPLVQDEIDANGPLRIQLAGAVASGDVDKQLAIIQQLLNDPTNELTADVAARLPPEEQAAFLQSMASLTSNSGRGFSVAVTPELPGMTDIMKSADPATASWLTGGGGSSAAPTVSFNADLDMTDVLIDAQSFRTDQEADTVDIPAAVDTSAADSSMAAFRRKEESDAIQIPVEFVPVNNPNTATPPGGGPSAPRSVNVTQHITAGFGTDRFALQRAIRKGNRDLNRLAGIRP